MFGVDVAFLADRLGIDRRRGATQKRAIFEFFLRNRTLDGVALGRHLHFSPPAQEAGRNLSGFDGRAPTTLRRYTGGPRLRAFRKLCRHYGTQRKILHFTQHCAFGSALG